MPFVIGRCPFPFPQVTNDTFYWSQTQRTQVSHELSPLPSDPFARLVSMPTEASAVKRWGTTCTTKDSLDFALSASYDNHRQWWVPPPLVKMQCPTGARFPCGRRRDSNLRICDSSSESCIASSQGEPVHSVVNLVNHEPYRNHRSHLGCHIPGPHVSKSTRGFSRSIDGLYYNS